MCVFHTHTCRLSLFFPRPFPFYLPLSFSRFILGAIWEGSTFILRQNAIFLLIFFSIPFLFFASIADFVFFVAVLRLPVQPFCHIFFCYDSSFLLIQLSTTALCFRFLPILPLFWRFLDRFFLFLLSLLLPWIDSSSTISSNETRTSAQARWLCPVDLSRDYADRVLRDPIFDDDHGQFLQASARRILHAFLRKYQ